MALNYRRSHCYAKSRNRLLTRLIGVAFSTNVNENNFGFEIVYGNILPLQVTHNFENVKSSLDSLPSCLFSGSAVYFDRKF